MRALARPLLSSIFFIFIRAVVPATTTRKGGRERERSTYALNIKIRKFYGLFFIASFISFSLSRSQFSKEFGFHANIQSRM